MKLNLNTWQRMMCVQALNLQAGHISMIRKALRLLEVLELDEAEREEVGLVTLPDGTARWKDEDRRFDLEISDRELAAHLKRAVAAYPRWPVGQGALVVDLFEQLGVEDEDGPQARPP